MHMNMNNSQINTRQTRATMPAALRYGLSLLVFAGLALLPLVVSGYGTFQLTMLMNYAIAILGIIVLTGYCGQISLGQGAFYGLGAYVAAILIDKAHVSYLLALPLAALTTFLFGALFSLPALRLKGLYLALATFSLALAFPQLLKHPAIEGLTGGVLGIALMPPEAPSFLPLTADHWLYLIALLSAAFALFATLGLLRSRIGRAFIAIRDNPIAAVAMGVDLPRYKALAFAFSAMLTGAAGALSAITVQYVAPDSFTMFLSITLLVGAVIGGVNSVWGVIFGALFIQFVPNVADQLSKSAPWMAYGLALILVVVFLPDGVSSLFRRLFDHLFPNMAQRQTGPCGLPGLDNPGTAARPAPAASPSQ
ncbi:branched-chain amino acid ABC transporter permease [Chelatococcus sp.]|uniref:branched-chain amino acid ABC transporter permease n=1 Tax=Chelatococcus sp. TaxID=1953771 RepID=UPI0025BDE228|nr:branched-chain amino acid ABC transporter permease [Chelatococcus sp.]